MVRPAVLLSVGLLAACSGDRELPPFTEDERLDGADERDDPDSYGTKMCVTPEGHVYVLWLDNREDTSSDKVDIWMNRSVVRGEKDSWLPSPVKVNQGEGNVWNPDLFCNELGVFVVWEDDRDGELENHQIYFNQSTDNGESFLDTDILLEIDPDGTSMSLEPKITGVGQDLFVVWYDSLNGAYDILVSSSGDAGLTWRDPKRVDSDQPAGDAYSARPEIAVSDNAQDVWVVWEDSRDGKADIYFAHSDSGAVSFDGDERLDSGDADGENDSFEPQLCTDGGSNVYAVWHDARNGEGRDIFFNYSGDAGGDWLGDARRLDSDNAGFGNSLYPACVADGPTAHVAWQDNRDQGYDIYHREIADGIPGDEEQRVDVGTPAGYANSLDTRIAFDNGTIGIAWRDGRGEIEAGTDNGYDDLYYNYVDAGAAFPVLGADEVGEDFRVDSMYDGQSFKIDLNFAILGGEWYAAWTDGRGGTSDVYFQRLPLGEAAVPPPLEEQEGQ